MDAIEAAFRAGYHCHWITDECRYIFNPEMSPGDAQGAYRAWVAALSVGDEEALGDASIDGAKWQTRTEAAEAALRAHEWQPIDTAPKDGTRRIVYANGVVCKALQWFVDDECRGWFQDGLWGDTIQPTHWMPLPDPPAQGTP